MRTGSGCARKSAVGRLPGWRRRGVCPKTRNGAHPGVGTARGRRGFWKRPSLGLGRGLVEAPERGSGADGYGQMAGALLSQPVVTNSANAQLRSVEGGPSQVDGAAAEPHQLPVASTV